MAASWLAAAALAALAGLTLAGPASADMSGLVGNTVVGSTPDKLTRRIQLHADGSFRISVSDGSVSTGTWTSDGPKLCYNMISPPPAAGAPNPLCVDGLDGHKVGDSWMTTGHRGLPMTMTVVAGQ